MIPPGVGGPQHVRAGADDADELKDGWYRFRLYVAGETPKSVAAIANLTKLCNKHLPGRHVIEVLDLVKNPELAAIDQIMAIPTLVRSLPPPLKRVIGTLSEPEKFLIGLDFQEQPS